MSHHQQQRGLLDGPPSPPARHFMAAPHPSFPGSARPVGPGDPIVSPNRVTLSARSPFAPAALHQSHVGNSSSGLLGHHLTLGGGGGVTTLSRSPVSISPSGSTSSRTMAADLMITLDQPRPEDCRAQNNYVETPLRGTKHPSALAASGDAARSGRSRSSESFAGSRLVSPHALGGPNSRHMAALSRTNSSVGGVRSSSARSSSRERERILVPILPTSQSLPNNHVPLASPGVKHLPTAKLKSKLTSAHHNNGKGSGLSLLSSSGGGVKGSSGLINPASPFEVPVTSQPRRSDGGTLKKGYDGGSDHHPLSLSLSSSSASQSCGGDARESSILCRDCGKCRCQSCQRAPPLPSRWLCDEQCLCSAETVVDYVSCLCCVKACFYHCGKDCQPDDDGDDGDGACVDRPCSCAPSYRCLRWGCMAALSVALPCLLCYWPLRACVKCAELGYQRCHRRGCRCRQRPRTLEKSGGGGGGSSSPVTGTSSASSDGACTEKRLLDH